MEKILISAASFCRYDPNPLNLLRKAGIKTVGNPYGRRLKKDEIISLGKGCVGIVAGLELYDREVLDKLHKLRVISRVGTGVTNIDLKRAQKLNIKVLNTPDVPTRAVAELSLALLFNLLRNVHQMNDSMKKGEWERLNGNLIEGKTIGIIGYGRIGRKVAHLLKGFGVSILIHDKLKESFKHFDKKIRKVSLDKLLKKSDCVMLHLSGESCIIGERELALMKKTSYLVNLSRGSVIDEKALYRALKEKSIAGAALDVFCKEPYCGRLRELENVILTPHVGSFTRESRIAMEIEAAQNLLNVLKKGKMYEEKCS